MTVPALAFSASVPSSTDLDVVVIGATVTNGSVALVAASDFGPIAAQLDAIGFGGGQGRARPASPRGRRGAGRGDRDPGGTHRGRAAIRGRVGHPPARRIPAGRPRDPVRGDAEAGALLEGAALGAYAFTAYRVSSAATVKEPVSSVVIVGERRRTRMRWSRTPPLSPRPSPLVQGPGQHSSVGPLPGDSRPAAAARARRPPRRRHGLGRGGARSRRIRRHPRGRPGLDAAVPRLVKVAYSPAGAGKHLALVGKGITFDTGGLSLKPPTGMVGMKYDMTGAATVLAVTLAAARLELPVRVTAWLCIAENMPSGTPIRPNDVLRIRGGKTVEVLNTDAEGRLVMADGLVAASEEHPDAIVDVATLTGAAMVALGTRYAAVMGDDAFVGQVVDAGHGDRRAPLADAAARRTARDDQLATSPTSRTRTRATRRAGCCSPASSSRNSSAPNGDGDDAARIPWAHLDIAGPGEQAGSRLRIHRQGSDRRQRSRALRLAEDFSRQ